MGSGGLVEAKGYRSGWEDNTNRSYHNRRYRTLMGESEPKPQCFKTAISHLRGFESLAKVA